MISILGLIVGMFVIAGGIVLGLAIYNNGRTVARFILFGAMILVAYFMSKQ